MEDRDYNEPRRDYCSPEEERYSRPNYETAEEYNKARRAAEDNAQSETNCNNDSYYNSNPYYNSHSYGEASHGNFQYGNQQYANLGGNIVDGNGVVLRNYFVIQLVFSIIEIISCCLGPVPMVLGIIALVFAIQANSAYTKGQAPVFKSKSKTSSILLIIGGAWMALSILFNIALVGFGISGMGEAFSDFDGLYDEIYDELYDNFYDDDSYISEYPGTDDVPLPKGFNEFTFNGVAYSLPMSFAEFEQMGYTIADAYIGKEIDDEDYEYISILDENGYYAGTIGVFNYTEADLPVEQCVVAYIRLDNDAAYEEDALSNLNFTFANGLDMNSTYEEIEAFMGTPSYYYKSNSSDSDYESYSWYYHGDDGTYQCVEIIFWDGTISGVSIESSDSY